MKILFVDDEVFATASYVDALRSAGHSVIVAKTTGEAKKSFPGPFFDLAILDIMLPLDDEEETIPAHGGYRAGLLLARWIKQNYPGVKIMGFTLGVDRQVEEWFIENTVGILHKGTISPYIFPDKVWEMIWGRATDRQVRTFIVHGHDAEVKLQLKNYLQNTLHLPEPVILDEQPSGGQTLIEKFERAAIRVDVVFVLLTPDDEMTEPASGGMRRPRQNVIFELGYFMAMLGRKRGKVILLYKSKVQLPSDIQGIVYIDISNGIEAAGEKIRRELSALANK